MKKRMSTRLGTAAAAGVMTLSMAVPAMAFEKSKETTVQVNGSSVRVSESTIDPDMTGSITLYKRLDNYGEYMQADGTPQAWVPGDPVRGVVLSYLKIADVETLADQGEVGVYYTNLSGAFVTYLLERGITQEDAGGASGSGTVLKADRTANGKNYYTTATMETLMNALNTDQTGVEDFLAKKGTAMAATDATGKTGADKLPLGLYLRTRLRDVYRPGDSDTGRLQPSEEHVRCHNQRA